MRLTKYLRVPQIEEGHKLETRQAEILDGRDPRNASSFLSSEEIAEFRALNTELQSLGKSAFDVSSAHDALTQAINTAMNALTNPDESGPGTKTTEAADRAKAEAAARAAAPGIRRARRDAKIQEARDRIIRSPTAFANNKRENLKGKEC